MSATQPATMFEDAPTDAALVESVRTGDRDAFGALARRCHGRVARVCLGMTGNVEDAEDLHHDALVEAYIKLRQLRDGARFAQWLVAIARNLGRMKLRERVVPVEDVYAVMDARVGSDVHAHEQLAVEYSRLSRPHRTALALHYWEGMSYEQIATLLGVPIGTVMSRLHRARAELKDRMNRQRDGQEQEMATSDDFVEDVQAEIDILNELFRDAKQPVERLSVLLDKDPGRIVELLTVADGHQLWARLGRLVSSLGSAPYVERLVAATDDDSLLGRMGRMLRWLDRAGFDVVLDGALATDAAVRRRARVALRSWIATDPVAGDAGGRAYWLIARVHGDAATPEERAELLLDLMEASEHASSRNLLTEYLLCDVETASPLLMERFRASESRPVLHALARTGARFCRDVLAELGRNPDADAARFLEALAAVGRSREPADSKWVKRPVADLALRQRSVESGAPYSLEGLDDLTLRDVGDVIHRYLDAPDPTLRASAVRACRAVAGDGVVDTLLARMSDPDAAPRIEAIIGLGELGGGETVDTLARAKESDDARERGAADQALGHQRSREIAAIVARLEQQPTDMPDEEARLLHEPLRWKGERAHEWLKSSDFRSDPVPPEPSAGAKPRRGRHQPSDTSRERLSKVRGDGDPLFHVSMEAAVRA
ncbi:sigma-70 family RNA polymerase sigma factor, partial [Candidatus Poribacteria bacterium]|nr:sigma-70 family RNA polymerase sigma factor [Candidatus Poribacteria bacterium]